MTDVQVRFSDEVRAAMIGRAATVDERIGGGFLAVSQATVTGDRNERLLLWRDLAARGDPEAFVRRLSKLRLTEEEAASWLGDVRLRAGVKQPRWLPWLDRVMSAWQQGARADAASPERTTSAIPFDAVIRPIAAQALTDLNAEGFPGLVSESGLASLEEAFTHRFAELIAPTLMESFRLFQLLRSPSTGESNGKRGLYNEFVGQATASGLREIFEDYPVLARVAATAYGQTLQYVDELLHRFAADRGAIIAQLCDDCELGAIDDVRFGISDRHNDGRGVAILHFSSGIRIVYKPRHVGVDVAWRALLTWLEQQGAPILPDAPRVLDRGHYGWFSYIESAPCRDAGDAVRYYRRAGALLCLVTMLRGTDCHLENIIASADRPVLVDLETLLHPRLRLADVISSSVLKEATRKLANSVLATGLLPNWVVLPGERLEEVGGLAFEKWRTRSVLAYKNQNTDEMTPTVTISPLTDAHLPRLGGRVLAIGAYRAEFTTGFAAMYRFLCAARAQLLEAEGPLSAFLDLSVRVVLRPTWLYDVIVRKSLNPRFLRDGAEWSVNFDFLARLEDTPFDSSLLEAVQGSERAAMTDLDVPVFHASTSHTAISGRDLQIEDAFDRPAWADMRTRLLEWNEEDLSEQTRMIGFAIDTAVEETDDSYTFESEEAEADVMPLGAPKCLEAAEEIADMLAKEALRLDGGAAWIGAMPLPGEQRCQLTEVGHNLLCGRGGIALFLAAMQQADGDEKHGRLAREALAPIRQDIREELGARRLMRMIGLGGVRGYGSIVYSLTKAAELLNDPALLDDALVAASFIDQDAIALDRGFDVVSGAAGCALALLALYRATNNSLVLETAIRCGHHILGHRQLSEDGLWRTAGSHPLAGFSHGMAGIGYAVTRLYGATGERAFLEAAEACHSYERQLFVPTEGNWPDLRGGPANSRLLCQWCHGAAGIGLARLGCSEVQNDPVLDSEIATAVATTRRWTSLTTDHVCCGNFGRIEFLLAAAESLRDQAVADAAARLAARVKLRAGGSGSYRFIAGENQQNPGFFFGIAGIGYEFLRLAMPGAYGSVLLLQ